MSLYADNLLLYITDTNGSLYHNDCTNTLWKGFKVKVDTITQYLHFFSIHCLELLKIMSFVASSNRIPLAFIKKPSKILINELITQFYLVIFSSRIGSFFLISFGIKRHQELKHFYKDLNLSKERDCPQLYCWSCRICCLSLTGGTHSPDFFPKIIRSLVYTTSEFSQFKCKKPEVFYFNSGPSRQYNQ